MSIGSNIKKYSHDMGMTQEELAGILCITSQAVSKWESGAGLPDITQVIPLAQALNVSTDALFGFNTDSYDMKLAEEVNKKANALRDSGDPAHGAYDALIYLDQQCEENIFNYGIMTRFVQAAGHMSRFVNPQNAYYNGIVKEDSKEWKKMVRSAENRAMQVIRYSGSKKLVDECHFALSWLCWHSREYEKGLEHVEALPSVGSNMLQETLLPYYIDISTDDGKEKWKERIRDNHQLFVRAFNKQILYTAESMMWVCPADEVEENCLWGIAVMEHFMENNKMKAHCQGFYRDTYKFLIGTYLRNNEPGKAAECWKKLTAKIDEYLSFCDKIREADKEEIVRIYGHKAADNMRAYDREWIDAKLEFILSQLKSWSGEKVYSEFEKLI